MKEVIKEVQKIEKVTCYEATDGTTFNSREECEKYEESAQGVLRGRLKPLIVNDKYDGWELMGGYEDNKVLAITVPTEEAIDVILQNYYLDQPWLTDGSNKDRKQEVEKLVRQAFENNDVILFGLNSCDELYIIDTRQNIINRLNSLDKKEESSE